MPDSNDFVWAYDTRDAKNGETATKLPHKVPRAHLRIFPYLSEIPSGRAKPQTSARRQPTQPPAPKAQTTED